MTVLLYNLLMAIVVGLALLFIGWKRSFRGCLLAGCAVGGAGAVMALPLGRNIFDIMQLAAYGLFLHGFILLAGGAILLRRARPRTALALAGCALAVAAVCVDAVWIEPRWLEVSHLRLESPKIRRPVRVVLLTDLQMDSFGEYEQNALRRALAEKPDLLLFGGDYIHAWPEDRTAIAENCRRFLKDLGVPAGRTFAIQGNIDGADWRAIFEDVPVAAAEDTTRFEAAGLALTCLSLRDSGDPDVRLPKVEGAEGAEGGEGGEGGRFHIVLGHRPDYALGHPNADLLLAGHTHGGQIRLPGIGPLLTFSHVPRGWAAGLTPLGGRSFLLVSRGVGMERGYAPRLRFFCRPEVVVIDLVPG